MTNMANIVDSDSTQTLLLFAIFALASLLHGISGLGVTLVTTTALASIYPLPHAIILVIFPSLLLNAMTWLAGGGRTVWQNFIYYGRRYWLLALTSLLGSMLGAKLLLWIDSAYILLVLAAVIGFYVVSSLLGKQIRLPNTKPVLIIVGLSAGIIGGATNAMSTILMMYLLSASDDNAMQVIFSERYEHDNVILEKESKDEIAEQLATIIGESIWQRHQS